MKAVIDKTAVWDVVRTATGLNNKEAQKLANALQGRLNRLCESALRMDRVELRQELEEEVEAKFAKREEALKRREEASGGMTRAEVIALLGELANGDDKSNVQAIKLLSELEGFGVRKQDIVVNIVDYSDAPDMYRSEVPDKHKEAE